MYITLKERWRWVHGWRGMYKVSSFGRVKSIRRRERTTRSKSGYRYVGGRYLTLSISNGYHFVSLTKNGKVTKVLVSRLILEAFRGLKRNQFADHINRKPGDNWLHNLRVATKQNNQHNQRRRRNNTSGYKGVTWNAATCNWRAHITHNYKTIHLGLFDSKEEAAKAYDAAARKLFGRFAACNF